jgi:hypothetical protein
MNFSDHQNEVAAELADDEERYAREVARSFEGKTVAKVEAGYGFRITFTDGTSIEVSSRYEGGVDIEIEIEETVEITRKRTVTLGS